MAKKRTRKSGPRNVMSAKQRFEVCTILKELHDSKELPRKKGYGEGAEALRSVLSRRQDKDVCDAVKCITPAIFRGLLSAVGIDKEEYRTVGSPISDLHIKVADMEIRLRELEDFALRMQKK